MNYDMEKIGFSFQRLLSLAEAAEIWGLEQSTIRKAILNGRLVDGRDCRKFGKQWVVTVDGMANAFKIGSGPSFDKWTNYLRHQRTAQKNHDTDNIEQTC